MHVPPFAEVVRRVRPLELPVALIGHRGESQTAPENTLPAIERAIEAGCHGIEFDVRRTADDHLVVFHDRSLKRTSNGRGGLRSLTLEALRALDAGSWFTDEFKDARIPTLDEALDVMQGRTLPLVEIKEGARRETGRRVVEVLRDRDLLDRSAIIVRTLKDAAMVKGVDPRVMVAVLAIRPSTIRHVLAANVEGLAPHRLGMRDWVAQAAREAGKWVLPWTVNRRDQMLRYAVMGVDGIMTDTPRMLQDVLEQVEVDRTRNYLADPEE